MTDATSTKTNKTTTNATPTQNLYSEERPASMSSDDRESQQAFEDIFLNNGVAREDAADPGQMGGPLYLDARGSFFQRRYLDRTALKREAKDGLSLIVDEADDCDKYFAMATSVPAGPWELHVMEADPSSSTLTVALRAGAWPNEPGWAAVQSELKVTRTFHLPSDADLSSADVAATLSGDGSLTIRVPKVGCAPESCSCAGCGCASACGCAGAGCTCAGCGAASTKAAADVSPAFVIGAAPERAPATAPGAAKGRRHGKAKGSKRAASPTSVFEHNDTADEMSVVDGHAPVEVEVM